MEQQETRQQQAQIQHRVHNNAPASALTPVWPPVRNAATSTPAMLHTTNGLHGQNQAQAHYTPSLGTNYTTASNEYVSPPSFASALRQYHHPNTSLSSHPPTTSTSTNTTAMQARHQPQQQQQQQHTQHQNMASAVNLYHLLTSQISTHANAGTGFMSGTSDVGASTERIIPILDAPQSAQGQVPAPAVMAQRDSSATTSGERWMRMAASSRRANDMATVRRQFRGKVVCNLSCGDCGVLVCKRGMKAILLADTTVELFSTDSPPIGVQMVNEDYETRNCHCRIRDVACLNCGNLVGYHVTSPCDCCMSGCNNGHFWMFHTDSISSLERLDPAGQKALLWSQIPFADKDLMEARDQFCR